MDLQQVAPGLWRWSETHPEWEPPEQEDTPADWPPEVGCVAFETPNTLVLIDPLVVKGDHAALDERAAGKERVAILVTVTWHERSRDELTRRYDAPTALPESVEALEIQGAGETIFWIPEHGALVPGDRILGDRPPGLRMCPESWLRHLGGYTQKNLRAGLQPLLDLPVEMVLVSHGEPVLRNGHAELVRALA
ncbi:MAG: hypothetical protein M3R37_05200 [Actinomycetota bacterium]|nr:hypothetical protein [Actinomycetota bacterium]